MLSEEYNTTTLYSIQPHTQSTLAAITKGLGSKWFAPRLQTPTSNDTVISQLHPIVMMLFNVQQMRLQYIYVYIL